MIELDFKKTEQKLFFGLFFLWILFFVGNVRTIIHDTLFGIGKLWLFLLATAVCFTAFFLYMAHLRKGQGKEKEPGGLRFLKTVHKYRFLISQLVERDFKVKYKRSVLGVFWSFLNPLLMMIVQYVVFSKLLNLRGNIEHYAIYLLTGIVIWNGFNDCTTQSMRSITGNTALITKVYVPKYIYPVTKVLSSFINVILSMIPLLLVSLIYGLFSSPHLYLNETLCLLPFGLLFLLVFCIGMGFLFSTLMVFFRDVEFLWTVISAIWMYATPIIYSLDMFTVAAWLVKLMQFNPIYHFISFFRTVILNGTPVPLREYLFCAAFSVLVFLIGYYVFRKNEDKFVLYL